MTGHMHRRHFIKAAAAGVGLTVIGAGRVRTYAANDAVHVGMIGVGGIGAVNRRAITNAGGKIVALCDVDRQRLEQAGTEHPEARRWVDFREMIQEQGDKLDAVMVSTPDHTHAAASVAAMRKGLHVSCEKPLTHSVYEARRMAEIAKECGVVAQMDNEGHGSHQMRALVEAIRAGAIGTVREVHVITDRPAGWWPQGMDNRPASTSPPDHLAWDLWLGPLPQQEYHPGLHPFNWRGWWDFGTGALGDMGCHFFDAPYWALELGHPESVEAEEEGNTELSGPVHSVVTYQFGERETSWGGTRPPVVLKWYDGGKKPPRPEAFGDGDQVPGNGSVFVGDDGAMIVEGNSNFRIVPERQRRDFKPPEPYLQRAPGGNHQRDWLDAIRTGRQPGSDVVNYSGPMTEVVLLGNVAIRSGERIEWEPQQMKIPNVPSAERYLRRAYREGWEL
jgi:predicted dehydrogenase